ncbi:MAG: M23 family metallopeptidase, partial [Pseudomonadota bacterium]|nr:M23 family metallopeptidase [Pseudomonadota bacterium]
LAGLQSSQEVVLEQLRERTSGNVKDAERIIEMTGLDITKVLDIAGVAPVGKGGSVAGGPENNVGGPNSALVSTLNDVEGHISRWEALKSVLKSLPLISPVDHYHLASRFGMRRDPFTKRHAMHYGLDLAGWKRAPVFATAEGVVVYSGQKGRYGRIVEVDHGNGLRTRYAHLFRSTVKKGQTIGHRHKIGLLGSTGRSTGPHVHYEILFNGKQIDPLKFIKAGRHVFKEPKAGDKPKAKRGKSTG